MAEAKERERRPTPEERFAELIAIQEKEREIAARLQKAREEAEQIIRQAREQAAQRKAHAQQTLQRECERRRAEARAQIDAEAQRIIAEGHVAAQHLLQRANSTRWLEKLQQEIFPH